MATALPTQFDRRRTRLAAELAASLTGPEQEIIDALLMRKKCLSCGLFGNLKGDSVVLTTIVRFTPVRREPRTGMERREDLAPIAEGLRRSGWLRLVPAFNDEPGGHFFLTPAAEWGLGL